jgi:cyclic pyranopterin phosphate synthase
LVFNERDTISVKSSGNHGQRLRAAGGSVNVSLDTLDREAYSQITDDCERSLRIDAAIAAGFEQIKLNTVLMRGRAEDQLIPPEFARSAI